MYEYKVRLDPTAITTAKTLVQYKAGADHASRILSARVSQITKTTTELLRLSILRKSAAATVTSATPLKTATFDPAAKGVGGTAATGVNASVEGTDGDVLESLVWNALGACWEWIWNGHGKGLWVPAAGIIAVKLHTAPAASMTIECEITVQEFPG